MLSAEAVRDMTLFELGAWLGYPRCCVEYFDERLYRYIVLGEFPSQVPRKLDGTGYIPCDACNQLDEEVLRARINAARRCSIPFPDFQDNDDE